MTNNKRFMPEGFLDAGFCITGKDGTKHLRSEFAGEYADIMAGLLEGMGVSLFIALIQICAVFDLSHEEKVDCLLFQAFEFVEEDVAPPLLLSYIKHCTDAIQDQDDWDAFHHHLLAIEYRMYSSAARGDNP